MRSRALQLRRIIALSAIIFFMAGLDLACSSVGEAKCQGRQCRPLTSKPNASWTGGATR